jgi:hypothetical protein
LLTRHARVPCLRARQRRRAFSDAEEASLQRTLGLTPAELTAMLDGAALAFQRAAAAGASAQARRRLARLRARVHTKDTCQRPMRCACTVVRVAPDAHARAHARAPHAQALADQITAAGGSEDTVRTWLAV